MGSGKSTIGRNLSERLHYDFVDLDDYIQTKEKMSISQIFDTKGEIYFRKKEHHYLEELLQREQMILSLGGGTPCYGNNMKTILGAADAKSIYLKCSIPNLVERLRAEKAKRPLIAHLKNDEELTEFIGKHLFERSFYYSQSDETIVSDGKSVSEIMEQIVSRLF